MSHVDPDPAFVDHVLDPLVALLGGEVFSRRGSSDGAITTYRWRNTPHGAEAVEAVRRAVLSMAGRGCGEIGGHGASWLVLIVERSARSTS